MYYDSCFLSHSSSFCFCVFWGGGCDGSIVTFGFDFLLPRLVSEMGVLDVTDDLSEESILFPCDWVATPSEGKVVDFAC